MSARLLLTSCCCDAYAMPDAIADGAMRAMIRCLRAMPIFSPRYTRDLPYATLSVNTSLLHRRCPPMPSRDKVSVFTQMRGATGRRVAAADTRC